MSDHGGVAELAGNALKQAFFLTVIILGVEGAAGFFSHSLALLADAGHILTDVVALGLAWFAADQARRPADSKRTYGYQRVGILTAMVNGATLIAIVVAVAYEAVRRFSHPEPVQGGLVIVSALVAIAVNVFITFRLKGGERDMNVRAALLHVVGDLAASAGVVVAGTIILITGWYPADPIVSLAIAALIAWGAAKVVVDTGNILLEGVPKGVDLPAIRRGVGQMAGVDSLHDLHVWALSPEQLALSCHVVVSEERLSEGEHLVRRLEQLFCHEYGIGHTTIQIEACHQCTTPAQHAPGGHNHPHGEDVAAIMHAQQL
ncbi:MAG: cation diffusion facilitator family transporter [Chloroflexota bacterium]